MAETLTRANLKLDKIPMQLRPYYDEALIIIDKTPMSKLYIKVLAEHFSTGINMWNLGTVESKHKAVEYITIELKRMSESMMSEDLLKVARKLQSSKVHLV